MTDYEKEFGVSPKQILREIERIRLDKVSYDQYGTPVPRKTYYQELKKGITL